MKKRGRKFAVIDWELLDKILAIGASLLDTSDIMNLSEDTVQRAIKKEHGITFQEYREKKMSKTRLRLRQKQIDCALAGNVTMLIWLGKQILGQSEKIMQVEDSTLEFE